MASDAAETPSPQPLPEGPDADVRMSRLHGALKQLKARGAAPLSTLKADLPSLDDRSAASTDLRNGAASQSAAGSLPSHRLPTDAAPAAERRQTPAPATPVSAPPLAPVRAERVAAEQAALQLRDCLAPAHCQQLERLANAILAQFPAGVQAAIAIAAVDAWQDSAGIAARLAWQLAERKDGETLFIEQNLASRGLSKSAPPWGLCEVVSGRADWSQAISPSAVAGLSLLGPGSAFPPEDVPLNEQWRSAMQQLKQRYRYIIADVHPRQNVANAAWLAAFDGIYLAITLRQSARGVCAQTAAAVKAGGAIIRGCIALEG